MFLPFRHYSIEDKHKSDIQLCTRNIVMAFLCFFWFRSLMGDWYLWVYSYSFNQLKIKIFLLLILLLSLLLSLLLLLLLLLIPFIILSKLSHKQPLTVELSVFTGSFWSIIFFFHYWSLEHVEAFTCYVISQGVEGGEGL